MNNIEQIFQWILILQHDHPDSSADWTHVHNKVFLLWNNDLNISIVWSFAWWREIGRNYKYVYLTCGYTLLYECWLWKNSVWVFDQGWFVMVSQTAVCLDVSCFSWIWMQQVSSMCHRIRRECWSSVWSDVWILYVSGLSLADDLLELVRCMADVWKGDGSLELRTFVYLCDEEWLRLAAGIEGLLFSRWVVVMSWCDEVPASSCLVQLIL